MCLVPRRKLRGTSSKNHTSLPDTRSLVCSVSLPLAPVPLSLNIGKIKLVITKTRIIIFWHTYIWSSGLIGVPFLPVRSTWGSRPTNDLPGCLTWPTRTLLDCLAYPAIPGRDSSLLGPNGGKLRGVGSKGGRSWPDLQSLKKWSKNNSN